MPAINIQESGFAIFRQVLVQGDIDFLVEALAKSRLPRSRAGMRHALRHPAVLDVAQDPRLLDIAKTTLGHEAFPFRATLFDKSSSSNWLVVWHQDTALPLRERRDLPGWGPWSVKDGVIYAHAPASALSRVIALRLHLDDSLPENGPLRVLPGTHEMGVLSDAAIRTLSEQATAVDCFIPCGGILAMKPLIVHASSKSRIEAPRRVLHIEYAVSASVGDGLELAVC
jgi:ectoine hydroxylase-related dioxygenase (phytanoyl-CoA dioxygenase family)